MRLNNESRHDFRLNNFDLLRLLAASQVVIFHGIEHLDVSVSGIGNRLYDLLIFFPGVPIFFVISGFLISLSYERNPNLKQYATNRVLRVYPALYVCFVVSLLTIAVAGYWGSVQVPLRTFGLWVAAQLSVGQFVNPSFLRDYGVGTLNGSLWTIPVELQFYLALPLLYLLFRRTNSVSKNRIFLALIVLFALLNLVLLMYRDAHSEQLATKLLFVSLIPYLYMFLTGVFIQRHFSSLRKVLEGKGLYWLTFYVASAFFLKDVMGWRVSTNFPNHISFLILAFTTISCAFTAHSVSHKLLRGNDISYGTYIYHMLIINLFIDQSWTGSFGYVLEVLGLTYVFALFSWWFIEKRALALKHRWRTPKTSKVEIVTEAVHPAME